MTEHTKVYAVDNMMEARNKIEELERQGIRLPSDDVVQGG